MITNSLIADFLACKQLAYLSLTSQVGPPTELDLHQQRIRNHVMKRFATAHESHIITTHTLDALRSSDLPQHCSPSYVIKQSFTSETCHLILDAIKILPSPSDTSTLSCIPIKASPHVTVSKNERLELCMIAILLQKHVPHLKCSHCTTISEWNAVATTFSLETHIREARRYLQQLTVMNAHPTPPRYYS